MEQNDVHIGGLCLPIINGGRRWTEIPRHQMHELLHSGDWKNPFTLPGGVELRGLLPLSKDYLVSGRNPQEFRESFANAIMLDAFQKFRVWQSERKVSPHSLTVYGCHPLTGAPYRAGYELRFSANTGKFYWVLVDYREAPDESVERMQNHTQQSALEAQRWWFTTNPHRSVDNYGT
jgi:hypothetical protein